jgi:hypothetical protein
MSRKSPYPQELRRRAVQTAFHSLSMDLIERGLRNSAPDAWRVRRQMTVMLGRGNDPSRT